MSKVIDNIEDIASIDSKVVKVTSTDNAVVRFDGTTGAVQNSGVTIDDGGNVGIGVTPSALLDIKAQGSDSRTIRSRGRTSDNISYIQFTDNAATAEYASISSGPSYLRFDTTGNEKMRIDSSGNLKFDSGYGSAATAYGCRAWVNFNGTGTVAIRASGNVSSITDNDTGDYTINFTTAMPDANYAIIGAVRDDSNDGAAITWNRRATTTNTTTAHRFVTAYLGTQYDCPQIDVAIFR